jgi:long-subunit acyl-CoA synthetase (AMP-forming)
MEGYGQTENCAGVTVQTSLTLGDVGPPLQHNEIRLVSVDEMGYRWDDKEHEVHGSVRNGCVCGSTM